VAKDPYKLLGVKKNATEKEIKKAYRALAKKLHPDVNPGDKAAAEKFKEITAANTLLTDKKLRAQYDSGGIDASGQQQNPFAGRGGQMGGMGGGDMSDLFSSLFGMQMGGARGGSPFGGGAQMRRPPQKGADVLYTLSVSLPDAVKGANQQVRMANGKSLKLAIPAGTKDEAVLRLRGKGQPGAHGGPNGDAKVTIKIKKHKYLSRDGDNLRLELPITLKEAVLGGKVRVPTPHGNVSLNITAGSSSGKTLRLKGKGVKGGDMLVKLMIQMPETLGKDLKKCMEKWEDDEDPRANINI